MEERLQKVLARAGIASRRGAEKLIETGRVTVNGRVIREMGVKVDTAVDEICVDTVALRKEVADPDQRHTYLLLHKPKGIVCTVRDDRGRTTVIDLVPPFPGKRLFPVGRLDEDSDGLVLMTNDGDLTQRLTHPSFGVPKTYDVRLRGRLTVEDAKKVEAGVWLSEGKTAKSRVQILRAGPKISHAAVTLTEGRNREIRRAFAKVGFPVLDLRRVQIGPIVSRGLKPGQFRPLDADELAALLAVAEKGAEGRMRPLRRRATKSAPRRSGKPDPAKATKPKRRGRPSGATPGGPAKRRGLKPGPAKGSTKRTGGGGGRGRTR